MNKVILMGNLGSNPELRQTEKSSVVNFNMATTEKWKDKDGAKQEHTEWHRIVVWGANAKHCAEYLQKGSRCLVEGKMKTRKWQDKKGEDRYTTEVVANNVEFIGNRQDKTDTAQPDQMQRRANTEEQPKSDDPQGMFDDPNGFGDEKGIPY